MKVLIRSPLDTLHNPISFTDPEARYSPFGENTTLLTPFEWPVSLNREHIDLFSILDIYSSSFFSWILGFVFITVYRKINLRYLIGIFFVSRIL